jgi:hypothetical protein
MGLFLLQAALPVAAGMAAGLAVSASRRRAVSLVGVLVGWTAARLLMSDEMNLSYRFQYSVLPVLLVLCAPLFREMRQGVVRASMLIARGGLAFLLTATVAGMGLSAAAFAWPAATSFIRQVSNREQFREASPDAQVTQVLRVAAKGAPRTVATTEAGYLAWKSGWTVTDLWGLNDKSIAHHGYLNVAQLTDLNPEVVVAHVPTGNRQLSSVVSASGFLPGWTDMTEPLLCFTHLQRYVLLGQWGDNDSLVVLARRDLPDLTALQAQFAPVEVAGTRNSASDGVLPTPAGCS